MFGRLSRGLMRRRIGGLTRRSLPSLELFLARRLWIGYWTVGQLGYSRHGRGGIAMDAQMVSSTQVMMNLLTDLNGGWLRLSPSTWPSFVAVLPISPR